MNVPLDYQHRTGKRLTVALGPLIGVIGIACLVLGIVIALTSWAILREHPGFLPPTGPGIYTLFCSLVWIAAFCIPAGVLMCWFSLRSRLTELRAKTAPPGTLQATRKRAPFVDFTLGVISLPLLYALTYACLRLTDVYYPFWNQGSWDEIDGTSHAFVIDVLFLPAEVFEIKLANRYHFLKEPSM